MTLHKTTLIVQNFCYNVSMPLQCLKISFLTIILTVLGAPHATAVDFDTKIRPLLEQHCTKCHGPEKSKAGLRLDLKKHAFAPAESGQPVIVAHQPEKSILVERLNPEFEDDIMPPKGDPLKPAEITLIEQWIKSGANWPDDKPAKKHYAYIKPVRPEIPQIKNDPWSINPIDHFINDKLRTLRQRPNPGAIKAKLIRRVYFDLIGLPPSIEEVNAFLNDTSPDAYEKVVDHLLSSPHYGERWAIQWLDLARYADSNGFQRDGHRTVYPYRDYVIKSFNADKPFDQFVIEQLAGDLLPNPTTEQIVATGFNRGSTVNVEAGVVQEENRINQIFDRVNTTGTVFLGTSLECAQCHNHKYDPITQVEYYRLFAFFNNTPIETKFRSKNATAAIDFTGPYMKLPLTEAQQKKLDQLITTRDQKERQLNKTKPDAEKAFPEWVASATKQLSNEPEWKAPTFQHFTSSGGSTVKLLDDHSLLVGGAKPDKDTYTIKYKVEKPTRIAAIKLEALTHPSLPGQGPGRYHPERPNFVLHDFTLKIDDKKQVFSSATADFSQDNYPVKGAIDGNLQTAWAINPQFHKPHHAIFTLKKPIQFKAGTVLQFTLVQNYGGTRTIGRPRISTSAEQPAADTLPANIVSILKQPAVKHTRKQKQQLKTYYLSQHPTLSKLESEIKSLTDQINTISPPQTLVMKEMQDPRASYFLKRGNYATPGQQLEPGFIAALHEPAPDLPPNRLGLAKWITDKDNPLLARVTVNRWWAEFFGRGIITTLEDIGTMSAPPSHPKLLDWLAVEFMANNWSMKHIHKLIIMSATYRQSSTITPSKLSLDPTNTYLARAPRIRLKAELIRDNALTISGLLSRKQFGPVVYPPQPPGIWRVVGQVDNSYRTSSSTDRYRRGIYTVWRRSSPYPSFVNFDAPDRAACTVDRPQTNTPLQALTLLNDAAYVEMTRAFAKRIVEHSTDLEEQLTFAWRTALAREPSSKEFAILKQAYMREYQHLKENPSAVKARIKNTPAKDKTQLATMFHIAQVIFNLDETITKD